eukprot:s3379_g19.t2
MEGSGWQKVEVWRQGKRANTFELKQSTGDSTCGEVARTRTCSECRHSRELGDLPLTLAGCSQRASPRHVGSVHEWNWDVSAPETCEKIPSYPICSYLQFIRHRRATCSLAKRPLVLDGCQRTCGICQPSDQTTSTETPLSSSTSEAPELQIDWPGDSNALRLIVRITTRTNQVREAVTYNLEQLRNNQGPLLQELEAVGLSGASIPGQMWVHVALGPTVEMAPPDTTTTEPPPDGEHNDSCRPGECSRRFRAYFLLRSRLLHVLPAPKVRGCCGKIIPGQAPDTKPKKPSRLSKCCEKLWPKRRVRRIAPVSQAGGGQLAVGAHIRLVGLSQAHFNGLEGFITGGPNEKGRYSVDVIVDDDEMTREMQTLSFKPETCQHDLYSNSCRPGFEGCSICQPGARPRTRSNKLPGRSMMNLACACAVLVLALMLLVLVLLLVLALLLLLLLLLRELVRMLALSQLLLLSLLLLLPLLLLQLLIAVAVAAGAVAVAVQVKVHISPIRPHGIGLQLRRAGSSPRHATDAGRQAIQLNSISHGEDKRLAIDIAILKASLYEPDSNPWVRWVPGVTMPSDGLTKEYGNHMRDAVMKGGPWSLLGQNLPCDAGVDHMPGRGTAAEASASPMDVKSERATKEVIDAQALQETAARTVRGAQQLFGNFTGWVREAQSAVADSFAGLAEEGVGPLTAVRRRAAERNAEAGANISPRASKRDLAAGREASRSDAAQYFVEYKGLDLSLLPPELQMGPART